MDWTKYNQVPTEYATATQIGLAAATLGAMERRGFIESKPTKPKQYRRITTPQVLVYKCIDENRDDFDEFFVLRKKDCKLGMLCSLGADGDVRDCWGNKYDLTNVVKVEFKTRKFDLEKEN